MPDESCHFESLGILGVGLIGGSIGLAARSRGLAARIVGCGRSALRLAAAQDQGVIDAATTDVRQLAACDLIVVCTPVDRIASDVRTLLDLPCPGGVITDAGSVKGAICAELAAHSGAERYVGSHPLAGSHLTGFEHAREDMFQDRVCLVTPTDHTLTDRIRVVRGFWEMLGMQVFEMAPDEHDRVLALTSHLPHLVAASLASLIDAETSRFAATGFGDTTRIAAADPDLWSAIFHANAREVVAATESLIASLHQFQDAIRSGDAPALIQLLAKAQAARRLLDECLVNRKLRGSA